MKIGEVFEDSDRTRYMLVAPRRVPYKHAIHVGGLRVSQTTRFKPGWLCLTPNPAYSDHTVVLSEDVLIQMKKVRNALR